MFEPPGETHTLVVPDDVEEMITYFQVNGIRYYCDAFGEPLGFEDGFHEKDRSVSGALPVKVMVWARTMSTSSFADADL